MAFNPDLYQVHYSGTHWRHASLPTFYGVPVEDFANSPDSVAEFIGARNGIDRNLIVETSGEPTALAFAALPKITKRWVDREVKTLTYDTLQTIGAASLSSDLAAITSSEVMYLTPSIDTRPEIAIVPTNKSAIKETTDDFYEMLRYDTEEGAQPVIVDPDNFQKENGTKSLFIGYTPRALLDLTGSDFIKDMLAARRRRMQRGE